jgi:hypothetical protein
MHSVLSPMVRSLSAAVVCGVSSLLVAVVVVAVAGLTSRVWRVGPLESAMHGAERGRFNLVSREEA